VQVNVFAENVDGVSSQSSARVQISASWHGIEPTEFPSHGGSSVTIFGACLPASMVTLEFSGFLLNNLRKVRVYLTVCEQKQSSVAADPLQYRKRHVFSMRHLRIFALLWCYLPLNGNFLQMMHL
jgi:hypothetical protein